MLEERRYTVIPCFQLELKAELSGHINFPRGCNASKRHIQPLVIVRPKPSRGGVLCLGNGFKQVLVEPIVANGPIVSFDVGVLLRLVQLDVVD